MLGGVEIGSQGDMFASQEVASQEVAQPRGNYVELVDILVICGNSLIYS